MNPKRHTPDFELKIMGIPAGVVITSYSPGYDAKLNVEPEDCYEGVDAEAEFIIVDRRGYRADWLANKMSESDFDDVERALWEHLR